MVSSWSRPISGGFQCGVFEPSTKFKEAAWNTPNLVTLFLLFFPIPFWNEICE
jgi:hypothetical protein